MNWGDLIGPPGLVTVTSKLVPRPHPPIHIYTHTDTFLTGAETFTLTDDGRAGHRGGGSEATACSSAREQRKHRAVALRPTHVPSTHAHAYSAYAPRVPGLDTRVGTPTPAHRPNASWFAFNTKALE